MNPKISVGIPSRGANPKLHQLLKDLANQTLKPLEVIVLVDDNTKPVEVPEGLNVQVIHFPYNVAKKRNELIHRAKGEYLLLVDDDNHLPSNERVEKLFELYQKVKAQTSKPVIIAPYSWHRQPGKIQAAGLRFSYLLSKMYDEKEPPKEFKKSRAL